MSRLKAFLQPTPAGKTRKVVISERFRDEEGKAIPFLIKAIGQDKNEQLARQSRKKGELDTIAYSNRLIVESTVEPNFKDQEVCEFFGVVDPAQVPAKMLSVGEYQKLQNAIFDINDIGETYDEVFDEAKNS